MHSTFGRRAAARLRSAGFRNYSQNRLAERYHGRRIDKCGLQAVQVNQGKIPSMTRHFLLALVIPCVLMIIPPTQATKPDGDAPAVQRFENLWLVTYIDAEGRETVAQARTASGEMAPLMAADEERLQSIIEAGKMLATSRHIKLRLVKFSQRSEVGEFSPVSP